MLKATINNDHELEMDIDQKEQVLNLNGKSTAYDLIKKSEGVYHIIKDHKSFTVEIIHQDKVKKETTVVVNGNKYHVGLQTQLDLLLESMGMSALANTVEKEVKAPMPGLVFDILIKEGQEVKEGEPLFILEAMKMENVIKSPVDATIKSIEAVKGTAVEKNQVLVTFDL